MRPILFVANRGFSLRKSRLGLITQFLCSGRKVIIATSSDNDSLFLKSLGADLFEIKFDRSSLFSISDILSFFKLIWLLYRSNPELTHVFHAKPIILTGIAKFLYFSSKKNIFITTITGLGISFNFKGLTNKFLHILFKLSFISIKV